MKAITVSNFREKLKTHLDSVSQNSEIIIIPRNNKEEDAIIVMSIAEYNSIKETEYLLSSNENSKRLRKALKEARNGQTRKVDLEAIQI
jgi:antitoxin YefM